MQNALGWEGPRTESLSVRKSQRALLVHMQPNEEGVDS